MSQNQAQGRGEKKKKPTSVDVAQLAGVSQSTVSRVFNEKWSYQLRGDARERVLKAAAELGYTPNAIAHILNSNHSGIVGIIVSEYYDIFYYEVLNLLTVELSRRGYRTMLLTSKPSDDIGQLLAAVGKYQADGVIVTSSALSHQLRDYDAKVPMPLVLFNGYVPGLPVSAVQSDNYGASMVMADYLYGQGYRSFAYVNSEKSIFTNQIDRQRGFLEGLERHGVGDCRIYPGSYDYASGGAAAEEILKNATLPDAIFCGGDMSTIGVIDALRSHGLREGVDIAVAGFEGSRPAAIPSYDVTAMRQDLPLMAKDSVEMLLRQIHEPESSSQVIFRPMELCVRSSAKRAQTK